MVRVTEYTKSHQLILKALTIDLEAYRRNIKKMKDRDLYFLMSALNDARNHIVEAVSNITKFEIKPSPEQFEDAEKVLPIIQEMQTELESRMQQGEPEAN
jgi:hypothetical protein